MLVNYHWDRTFYFIQVFLTTPYLALLSCFTFWSNFVLGEEGSKRFAFIEYKIELTILVLSAYFLALELYRIGRNVRKYLSRPASVLDAIPQILLIINICKKF